MIIVKIEWTLILIVINVIAEDVKTECIKRHYNENSFVCVCNSSHCDEISKVETMNRGNYILYSSDMKEKRFHKTIGEYIKNDTKFDDNSNTILKINRKITFQKIIGFGGSFTDSTGINIMKLKKKTRKNLINAYFSENGLEYNMGRVPIGGTDFSTRFYTYNMMPENDVHLSNYTLEMEDFKYKIPLISEAVKISTDELYLVASSWYTPEWMKNPFRYGTTQLKSEYYQTWADYHLKFLEEYKKNDVNFWAITTGNEPSVSIFPIIGLETLLGWLPVDQGKWITNHFGPTIRNSKFSNITILGLDDQRMFAPWWLQLMEYNNKDVMNYIDGVALHWYADPFIPVGVVQSMHNLYPKLFIISTESSIDLQMEFRKSILYGSWDRAERYGYNIIEDLNNWYTGWIDWNMALNLNGGPNWSDNNAESLILVDKSNDEFLKQPMYYAFGHFSKFIPRDSVRIKVDFNRAHIKHVAFLRPDKGVVVVLLNRSDIKKSVIVKEKGKAYIKLTLSPKSINTLLYW